MKNLNKNFIIVFVTLIGLFLIGCFGRNPSTAGSSQSTAVVASQNSPAIVRESPVTDFSYDLTADGRGIRITGYTGRGGAVVIPSKIEDIQVLEIGPWAFSGGRNSNTQDINNILTSIIIPDSVEIIGNNAFYRNNKIRNLIIPDSITIIGDSAFASMSELRNVTLSNNLKVIPRCLFQLSRNLTSVNFPLVLEEIHALAFEGCRELNEIIIPDTLTSIRFIDNFEGGSRANNAFVECQKLPIRTRQRLQELGYTGIFGW